MLAASAALGAGLAASPAAAVVAIPPHAAGPAPCVNAPVRLCPTQAGVLNSNDYPAVRSGDFVRIRFGGINSPHGGVLGVEPGLSHAKLNGGASYAPCKGAPTAVPNMEDPVSGGEPYKAACENTVEPSYYRSGAYGPGLGKRAALFENGIEIRNKDLTQGCAGICTHRWADRLSRFDVEFYLKKRHPQTGKHMTDFEYVRPRFTVSSFPHRRDGGFVSADYGTITPLRAYQPGTARAQGLIYSAGRTGAAPGRVRFSMFENDANGRTSTGQPLQAFSVFTSTGSYYTTGTVYAGSYKLRLKDLEANRCVLIKHLPLPSMGQRFDIHLDRPAFGISRARTVAC